MKEWEERVAVAAEGLKKTSKNEKERLANLNMTKGKTDADQRSLKNQFKDRIQKSESKAALIRELAVQVEQKKIVEKVE